MFRSIKLLFVIILFFIVKNIPFVSDKTKAKAVLKLIKMGGVTFVKLGQSLAVRPDIVGASYADEFKNLQDNMPAFSYGKVKSIIEKNLGKNITDVFKSVDEVPVGCASIAQVHKGVLKNGDTVAIKVLRPNIRKVFLNDIKLFFKMAVVIETIIPKTKRLNLFAVVSELNDWVNSELSLLQEAKNAKQLYDNFAVVDEYQGDFFKVPKVYDDLSTDDIMVLSWIDGIRIDNINEYKKLGINPKDILKKSATVFFLQVFRDGFFHADMHPGNMFINKKGELLPVDFGIMGKLDKKTRTYIADVLYYIMKQDYTEVANVHFKAGYVPSTYGIDEFANAIESIDKAVRKKGTLSQISMGELLSKLFETTERFQMKTRPELLLLQKTIVVAEGVGRTIAPKENMWNLISDLIEQWFKVNRGISARIEEMIGEVFITDEVQNTNSISRNSIVKKIYFDLTIIAFGGTAIYYTLF
ncbi:MAG: ABC1 kinase family protein [Alphaproteobacteria bacterium]